MISAAQAPARIIWATRDGLLQRLPSELRSLSPIAAQVKALAAAVAMLIVAASAAVIASLLADAAVAYGIGLVAAVLVAALVGTHAWRHRPSAPRSSASPAGTGDVVPPGFLRSAAPFTRPPLPERADEAEAVFDLVTAAGGRFGALVGRSGSGKTSLLRAELLPRLAMAGLPAVYVPMPGADVMTATRDAVLGRLARAASPPPAGELADADLAGLVQMLAQRSGKTVTLVYDQFDMFLLGGDQPEVHDAFVNWLRLSIGDAELPVRFLFAVRDDLLSRFLALEALVVEGQAPTDLYDLHDLTPEAAQRVLRQTVFRRETGFEADLISEVVRDLTDEGLVSPTLLQIVATWLKQHEIRTARQYRDVGEAAGILQAYVRQQLEATPSPQAARAILQVLVREPAASVSEIRAFDEFEAAVGALGTESDEERESYLRLILRQLTSARLLVRRCRDGYAIAYPLLHSAILSALDEPASGRPDGAPSSAADRYPVRPGGA